MWRPFIIALQLLSRIPTPSINHASNQEMGRSLLFYPLIGLIIGSLLAGLSTLPIEIPNPLFAALLLTVWILITGGLHLDGLADSADAWLGGYGDRDRTLSIMKDPCSGPAATIAIVLVLLLKYAALLTILINNHWPVLILAPLLARWSLPLLFLTTPYVRPSGLGDTMVQHQPKIISLTILLATAAFILWATEQIGLILLITTLFVFILIRILMIKRIEGTTGDTAGAMVELIETAVLIAAVCVPVH